MGIHGRACLNAAAKSAKTLRRSRDDRLNDVVTGLVPARLDLVAEFFKYVSRQMRGLESLRDGVRGIEKSLVERLIVTKGRACLATHADRGQTVGAKLHGAARARQITTRFGHAATGVFDERADHKIRSHGAGLGLLDKLTVAVVHHHEHVGIVSLDLLCKCPDLGNREGLAVEITLGALDEYHLHPRAIGGELFLDGRQIKATVSGQLDLIVIHAEIAQRAVSARARDANDLLQGVIGLARDREHHVTGAQDTEKTHGQRVRAADDLLAHQRGLTTHNLGPDEIQLVTAAIIVAVSRRSIEIIGGYAMGAESIHHPIGVGKRDLVNARKNRGKGGLGLPDQIQNSMGKLHIRRCFLTS